jgi:FlaA1/EpsC-like NDP-sugar epimerase
VFTGLRPGEKLFEELLADDDLSVRTHIERVRIAQLNDARAGSLLQDWLARCEVAADWSSDQVRTHLRELVRELREEA